MSESGTNQIAVNTAGFLLSNMYEHPGMMIDMPFSRDIKLINAWIAGTQYRENFVERTSKIEPGYEVKLIREADNPYDDKAILVLNKENESIGYVPRRCNEVIASLMDAGKLIYGRVTEINRIKTENEETGISRVFMYMDIFMKD